jgi:hypothetical protein
MASEGERLQTLLAPPAQVFGSSCPRSVALSPLFAPRMLSLAANQSRSADLFPQLRQTQQKPRLDDLFLRQLQSHYSPLVNLL